MSLVDISTLPLETPLVMAFSSRDNLDAPGDNNPFIELCKSAAEMVSIRSAVGKELLVLNSYGQCSFYINRDALKFKVKVSPAGRFVFEEHSTGHVLEIEYQGDTKLVVCRNKYSTEKQSWYLLQRQKLDASIANPASIDPLSLVTAAENEEAGRRQLILHLLESGKSTKEVGEIVTLVYGSTAPQNEKRTLDAIGIERRQQILEFLEAGKSATEVGEILTLLYGTSSPPK